MKKLTRYKDFDTLKLDVKSTNTNSTNKASYFRELEDFLKLLRSKLITNKKK